MGARVQAIRRERQSSGVEPRAFRRRPYRRLRESAGRRRSVPGRMKLPYDPAESLARDAPSTSTLAGDARPDAHARRELVGREDPRNGFQQGRRGRRGRLQPRAVARPHGRRSSLPREARSKVGTMAMPRYAAFLRGVSPMNAKMPELKRALEAAGFKDVATLLSSGNIVFDAPRGSNESVEKRVEAAIEKGVGKSFMTIVRSIEELRALLESDPYRGTRLTPEAKRIVTFVRKPPASLKLPIERDNARILRLEGSHLFTAYLPTPKGPVFMALIEKAVGKQQTSRTWQTLEKVAR